MANDLAASARTTILALASKPLATTKESAESAMVAHWDLQASVLGPFEVLLVTQCI